MCSSSTSKMDNITPAERSAAAILILPETKDRALGSPLAHPALCSQRGPSSPPDPSHQPITAQK